MTSKKSQTKRKILNVLIIEDQTITAVAVKKFLEFRGHAAAIASNESEALETAEKLQPNIVISDWKLKDGDDGVLVSKRLQKEYGTSIFMVTARRLDDLRNSLEEHQLVVQGVVRKPVSLNELAQMIESV